MDVGATGAVRLFRMIRMHLVFIKKSERVKGSTPCVGSRDY